MRRSLVRSSHSGLRLGLRKIEHVYQLDIEDEVSFGRNALMAGIVRWTAGFSISHLVRDEQPALATYVHSFKAEVPAGNHAGSALKKKDRLSGFFFRFSVIAHLWL